MSKLTEYLRAHIAGEVLNDQDVLKYFSVDGSVFKIMPRLVIYPRHEDDIRKALRFGWQVAEKGQYLPITARGKGTDQAGAAIGEGVVLVMPAHLNKHIGFSGTDVVVQPGMVYGDLQRTLHSHGRFLPPYPSSIDFSSVGGAVANNACGEKSLKYGATKEYVKSLNVVLANGQLIKAEKISPKELNRKKGLTDLEGEIYRQLDGLLEDKEQLIKQAQRHVSKNAAGYDLWNVKGKDGSFDLSKLIVGSQGTLGVVTEITFSTEAYNPQTHLMTVFVDELDKITSSVAKLDKLKPSAVEIVDYHLLSFVRQHFPAQLEGIIEGDPPKAMLIIEFDDANARNRERKAKKAEKLMHEVSDQVRVTTNLQEQDHIWKLRHSAAAVIWQDKGTKKALPIIEDGVVPVEKLHEFLEQVYALFKKHKLDIAVWGHAGDGNFHLQPFLDLNNVGDRQLMFKLMDKFYEMVIGMGGSTSGEHNDGRLRGAYLKQLYGVEMYQIFEQVKKIFDPYNILNPGVKVGVDKDKLMPLLRHEYSMPHLYDHMPHLS